MVGDIITKFIFSFSIHSKTKRDSPSNQPAMSDDDNMTTTTTTTTTTAAKKAPAPKRSRLSELVVIQSIQSGFKSRLIKKQVRYRDETTGDMASREEDVTPQVSSDLYEPLDERVKRWLREYPKELASFKFKPANDVFVVIRRTQVEVILGECDFELTPLQRNRILFNVCNFVSGAIESAIDNIFSAITVYARNVMPYMDFIEAMLLAPMKQGIRSPEDEESLTAAVVPKKRKRTVSAAAAAAAESSDDDDDDDEEAPPPPKKAAESAPAPSPKKTAKVAAPKAPKPKKVVEATEAAAPEAPKPEAPKPKAAKPKKVVEAAAAAPEATKPEAAKPEAAKPKAAKPKAAKPKKVVEAAEAAPKAAKVAPRPPKAPQQQQQVRRPKEYDDDEDIDINKVDDEDVDDFSGGYSE